MPTQFQFLIFNPASLNSVSFDLHFHSRHQTGLRTRNFEEYFERLNTLSRQEEGDRVHFHFNNEETWVYCTFSIRRSKTAGNDLGTVEFRLNYNRPISFPWEAFPLVQSFAEQFDLLVEDVQEQTIEQPEVGRLVDSWRVHNVSAVRALAETGTRLRYFPESKTFEWWRYTRVRKQIELALTEDVFVPTVVFLETPEKRTIRMFVFPEAAGQLLPPSDYVWVQRRASSNAIGSDTETGLIRYDELVTRIGRYLSDYETFGEKIKYLSPANALSAVPIIRRLDLMPVDLTTYNGITPDGFHNVELT